MQGHEPELWSVILSFNYLIACTFKFCFLLVFRIDCCCHIIESEISVDVEIGIVEWVLVSIDCLVEHWTASHAGAGLKVNVSNFSPGNSSSNCFLSSRTAYFNPVKVHPFCPLVLQLAVLVLLLLLTPFTSEIAGSTTGNLHEISRPRNSSNNYLP